MINAATREALRAAANMLACTIGRVTTQLSTPPTPIINSIPHHLGRIRAETVLRDDLLASVADRVRPVSAFERQIDPHVNAQPETHLLSSQQATTGTPSGGAPIRLR